MATQSLYRRYRPRRFSELKGQDHVVRALRDAVATGREGQAYLFSGPRGTGKTTSARVLAKALNCENVVDGEPCCECDSCHAVESGTSYDVHELDAASNNGVDAIRDLVEKAALGTPGRHKVYILDEVHMLSKAAEAALLKTLEEPPPHVVFVLATTDPQKMSDTIRSRTQHLQFHLLPADTLAEHVRWVASDAGLTLTDEAFDAALSRGGGSARDTLSALELIASTGGEADEAVDLDEFVDAMIEHDPGRALTTMAKAVNLGHDPRTITEDLIRHLRNLFLSLMAPELVLLPSGRIDEVAARAKQLGAAAIVRAIEQLGGTLADMRHAPDPRVLVEVALVQLTHEDDGSDASLRPRLDRIEQQIKQLNEAGPAVAAPPTDPATGKATLGGAAMRPQPVVSQPSTSAPPSEPSASTPSAPADDSPAVSPASDVATTTSGEAATVDLARVTEVWDSTVRGSLKPLVRALYSAGSFVNGIEDRWRFEVPNEAHGAKCEPHRADVEAAMASALGTSFHLSFTTGGGGRGDDGDRRDSGPSAAPVDSSPPKAKAATPAAPTPPSAPADPVESERSQAGQRNATSNDGDNTETVEDSTEPGPGTRAAPTPITADASAPQVGGSNDAPVTALPDDDDIDLSELTDAPPESVKTPIDHLAEAFPGSELIAED